VKEEEKVEGKTEGENNRNVLTESTVAAMELQSLISNFENKGDEELSKPKSSSEEDNPKPKRRRRKTKKVEESEDLEKESIDLTAIEDTTVSQEKEEIVAEDAIEWDRPEIWCTVCLDGGELIECESCKEGFHNTDVCNDRKWSKKALNYPFYCPICINKVYWVKTAKHPWHPGMIICWDDIAKQYTKKLDSMKKEKQIVVQFFSDNKYSWVGTADIKLFDPNAPEFEELCTKLGQPEVITQAEQQLKTNKTDETIQEFVDLQKTKLKRLEDGKKQFFFFGGTKPK